MSLLEIDGLTHSFGENVLYKNAGFTLNKGEHIGIVGQNGTGKSTLIKICTEQIIPDSGRIVWQPNTTIGYLDQYAEIDHTLTMKEFLKSAFTKLFEMEAQAMELYEKAAGGDMKSLEMAARYQEQLEAHDFYSIDTAIERVANGLGLLAIGLDRPIAEMSGGQRAKVILAKLLLEKPDVLLLDEPTNFLDKDHVTWLAEYLSTLENAFLVVSHDFNFLDKIANRICDIDNDTITKYYGTYSEFLRKKTLLREDYVRQYAAQQKEIKKTEEFIRKNIAGRKAKMARGRQKQLDRMDKMEALDQKEIIPHFHFPVLPLTDTEHLLVKHLAVGYHYPVLSNIEFSIKGGQKVVITGFNGIGKSTLLILSFSDNENTLYSSIISVLASVADFSTVAASTDAPLLFGSLQIDPQRRLVWQAGQTVDLTPMEFDILLLLARRPGQVFSLRQIYEAVATDSYDASWTGISSMVYKLRRKLGASIIETVYGRGYRFPSK